MKSSCSDFKSVFLVFSCSCSIVLFLFDCLVLDRLSIFLVKLADFALKFYFRASFVFSFPQTPSSLFIIPFAMSLVKPIKGKHLQKAFSSSELRCLIKEMVAKRLWKASLRGSDLIFFLLFSMHRFQIRIYG